MCFCQKRQLTCMRCLVIKSEAVAILQKAAEDHYLPVAEVKMDPRFAELRKDRA